MTYDNPGTIFGDVAQPGQSCFDSERLEQGAVQCLRFDQVLQNIGTGALELRFTRQTGVFQDEDATQRITGPTIRSSIWLLVRWSSTECTRTTTSKALPSPNCGCSTATAIWARARRPWVTR
jgi:hypothetical protein